MNRKQRHMGRELALQWIFQIDVGHGAVEDVLAEIPDELVGLEEEGISFGRQLARGVIAERKRIDAVIEQYSKGWPMSRMPGVDRNILRIAMYELFELADIPSSVSVDEAVEVAKQYGTEDSGKFVNGILGAYLRSEPEKTEEI